ncbi:hypothetical protein H4R26_005384, partial [Coemansia thaxteri]
MKFGLYLEAEQVPEWEKMYVDYQGLKQLIKAVAVAIEKRGAGPADERFSLLNRTSTYLGYNSIVFNNSPHI